MDLNPGNRLRRVMLQAALLAVLLAVTAWGAPQAAGEELPVTQRTWFLVIAYIAIAFQSFLIFLALFEPGLEYKVIRTAKPARIDSENFLRILEAVSDARVHRSTCIQVLPNGENYYPAELEAIRAAKKNICVEAYIFAKGKVTASFIQALAERARAGVQVNVVLDAIGAFATWNSYMKPLTDAGGRVAWYHPIRWYSLMRLNNRTHRELIIVDGKIGFIGGAGYADHWLYPQGKHKRWRDSMYRVEGDAVTSLQATFVENWLEATGEILAGEDYFPRCTAKPNLNAALVVSSTPTIGSSTATRILFQTLLVAAQKSIYISTPYFVPDRSAMQELVNAAKRGVDLQIITPGHHNDHAIAQRSARRRYGVLLEAGAKIFEYEPGMFHVKSLVVDGHWTVVGSSNFDNRSFGLNDEVNLASCDPDLGARLTELFVQDRANSRQITMEAWRRRYLHERLHEWAGWLLERQQ